MLQLFTHCLPTIISVMLTCTVHLLSQHLCFGNIVFTSLLCLLDLPLAFVELVTWIFCLIFCIWSISWFIFLNLFCVTMVTFVIVVFLSFLLVSHCTLHYLIFHSFAAKLYLRRETHIEHKLHTLHPQTSSSSEEKFYSCIKKHGRFRSVFSSYQVLV